MHRAVGIVIAMGFIREPRAPLLPGLASVGELLLAFGWREFCRQRERAT